MQWCARRMPLFVKSISCFCHIKSEDWLVKTFSYSIPPPQTTVYCLSAEVVLMNISRDREVAHQTCDCLFHTKSGTDFPWILPKIVIIIHFERNKKCLIVIHPTDKIIYQSGLGLALIGFIPTLQSVSSFQSRNYFQTEVRCTFLVLVTLALI